MIRRCKINWWLAVLSTLAYGASARPNSQEGVVEEIRTRFARQLLQNSSIQSSIAGPAPLSIIQSPCCCVANVTAVGGQTCCCGADKSCCSANAQASPAAAPANFCKNGCAVLWTFVGVAIAFFLALIAAIYFRRQRLLVGIPVSGRYNGMRPFAGRSRRKEPPRRPMQALPTTKPHAEEEGKARECPVCLEENTSNDDWTVFPCKHATCIGCYTKLCKGDSDLCMCPMCRTPLMEPVPDPHRKWELTSTDGTIPMMTPRSNQPPLPAATQGTPGHSGAVQLASRSGSEDGRQPIRTADTVPDPESEFEIIPIDAEVQERAATNEGQHP